MSTYITRQIKLQVAQEQSGQNLVIRRGDKETRFNGLSALAEAGIAKLAIPIPTVDKDLMEGHEIAVGRIVYLETDTELLVKLDDVGDTGITVKPLDSAEASDKPGVLYLEGDFTHVYISVSGASGTANVVFGVVGA